MKTLYAACLSRLGLSQAGAAALHGVGLQTVKNWCSGRSAVPEGIWDELRQREDLIVDRSEAVRELWQDTGEAAEVAATWRDEPSLMSLADFVLNAPVRPV